jgi:hypothetical protein
VALLAVGACGQAAAAAYKGVGGKIEAYGTLSSTYALGLKVAEICQRHPGVNADAVATVRTFRATNQPLYDRLTTRLKEIALQNGGEAELRRLSDEAKAGLLLMEKSIADDLSKSKFATSESACAQVLPTYKTGQWDLKVRNEKEVALILGSAIPPARPPDNSPFVDGCIDSQKSVFAKKGKPYIGNEEIVREYCYCMAPISMDIAQTAEGRAKLIDSDPVIVARLKKMEAICNDAIHKGRRYAPK